MNGAKGLHHKMCPNYGAAPLSAEDAMTQLKELERMKTVRRKHQAQRGWSAVRDRERRQEAEEGQSAQHRKDS